MKEFTKRFLSDLDKEIQTALNEVAKRNGVQIKIGGGSFTPTQCDTKIKIIMLDESGSTDANSRIKFERSARKFGYDPNDFGKTVEYAGYKIRISGVASRSRKNPIIGVVIGGSKDGRTVKLGTGYKVIAD